MRRGGLAGGVGCRGWSWYGSHGSSMKAPNVTSLQLKNWF